MEPNSQIVSYFVRHGSTALNQNDSFRGPLNVPLDAEGIQQGKDLNAFFKPIALGAAYSSDMDRTLHTADLALAGKGMSVSPTADLRALNVGNFAGQPKAPNQFQMQYYQDNPNETIPGGESLHAFRKRVQPRIKTAILAGIQTGVPSVSFVHSSIIHEVSHIITGNHNAVKVKPGGVVGVGWDGKNLSAKALFREQKRGNGYGG
jgi:broad specificity phosphatase PhoE